MNYVPRLLMLLLLAIQSVPATASDGLEVETTIGFNGLVKLKRWNPVTIYISNTGKRVDGTLTVEVKRGTTFRAEETVTFNRRLHLPAGSRKRFMFSVPIINAGLPLYVRIKTEEGVLFSSEHSVLGKIVPSFFALALSRTAAFDFLMSSSRPKDGEDILVTYPHVETLPDRWDAYDSVDYIIIHNVDLLMIKPEQSEAIEKWVDGGGVLFISGGTHLKRNIPSLETLIPVQVMGLAMLSSPEALSNVLETDITVTTPVPVTMGRVTSGRILAESDGIPLLVYHPRGDGGVIFFAGDIGTVPFSNNDVRNRLWQIAKQAYTGRNFTEAPERLFDDAIIGPLIDLGRSTTYSRSILLILVAAYLVAVMIFILGGGYRPGRAKERWIGILVIPLVFAAVGYFIFAGNLLESRHLMLDVTTIHAKPGGTYAKAVKNVVLVSLNDREYSLSVDRQDSMILGWGQPEIYIREDSTTSVEHIHIESWDQQTHSFVSFVRFPIEGFLERKADTLSLRVKNSSSLTIQDGVLIYRGEPNHVGSVAPDEYIESSYRIISSPMGEGEPENTIFNYKTEPYRAIVLDAILHDPLLRESMERGSVVLVGWLSDPLVHVTSELDFQHNHRVNILISIFQIEDGVANAS